MQELKQKKVWYVALIWRPNSGKSTFINHLIWEKVSIISDKPQTTRKVIKWIYNDEESQIIFFDTPWVNESNKEFNLTLNEKAIESIKEADLVVRFIDSSRTYWKEEETIENFLQFVDKKIIVVYTKSDLSTIQKNGEFYISSVTWDWVQELLQNIKNELKTGFQYYSDDHYTDQDIYTRITEIVREKIFTNFSEEVPHSTYVDVEDIEETNKLIKVNVTIYTETDSQKYIIIWKWWKNIADIWLAARTDLEKIFSKKFFLGLRVKVMPKWRKNKKIIWNILN